MTRNGINGILNSLQHTSAKALPYTSAATHGFMVHNGSRGPSQHQEAPGMPLLALRSASVWGAWFQKKHIVLSMEKLSATCCPGSWHFRMLYHLVCYFHVFPYHVGWESPCTILTDTYGRLSWNVWPVVSTLRSCLLSWLACALAVKCHSSMPHLT